MNAPPPTSFTAQGHDGLYILRRKDTGLPVAVGDAVNTFRGEFTTLRSGEAPHKESSQGFVTTDLGRGYASVYELQWVKVDA